MSRQLTKKQKGFVKDYVRIGIASQAVKRNYPDIKTDLSARVQGSRLLTNDNVVKSIAERLPDDLLEERHLELLNKRETISRVTEEGELIKHDLGPDVQGVSKGLDMAYKLKGSYAAEKTTSLNVNVEARLEDKSGLEAIREEYEEKLKQKLINETK